MIDIKALLDEMESLQEKLTDRETRLKAMEKAYFEMVTKNERLEKKLESLEAKV